MVATLLLLWACGDVEAQAGDAVAMEFDDTALDIETQQLSDNMEQILVRLQAIEQETGPAGLEPASLE